MNLTLEFLSDWLYINPDDVVFSAVEKKRDIYRHRIIQSHKVGTAEVGARFAECEIYREH